MRGAARRCSKTSAILRSNFAEMSLSFREKNQLFFRLGLNITFLGYNQFLNSSTRNLWLYVLMKIYEIFNFLACLKMVVVSIEVHSFRVKRLWMKKIHKIREEGRAATRALKA